MTLRHAANEFSNSSHRLRVRDHAESVQLESLSIDAFFELLDGLFKVGNTYHMTHYLFDLITSLHVVILLVLNLCSTFSGCHACYEASSQPADFAVKNNVQWPNRVP